MKPKAVIRLNVPANYLFHLCNTRPAGHESEDKLIPPLSCPGMSRHSFNEDGFIRVSIILDYPDEPGNDCFI